jgi:hypothetical protein
MGFWAKTDYSTQWKSVKKLWVKTTYSTAWKSAKKLWVKTANGTWQLFWPKTGPYAILPPYITLDAAGNNFPSGFDLEFGTNVYGQRGIWDANSTTSQITSYSYKTYNATSSILGQDFVYPIEYGSMGAYQVLDMSLEMYDGSWLVFQVEATRADGISGDDNTDSNGYRYFIHRKNPVNNYHILTLSGNDLIYSSNWSAATKEVPDVTRSVTKLYRNTTNSTTGGTLVATYSQDTGNNASSHTTSYSTSFTYDISTDPNNSGKYFYVVETQYNSGTDWFGTPVTVTTGPTYVQIAPTANPGPFLSKLSGTGMTVGDTYRLYAGTWTGSPYQYQYYIDYLNVNNVYETISMPASASTYTTDNYIDFTIPLRAAGGYLDIVVYANNGVDSEPWTYQSSTIALGSPSVTSSSLSLTDITLNFSKAPLTSATRAYIDGSFDGATTGDAYIYLGLTPNTSYVLTLRATTSIDGTQVLGPPVSNTYTTSTLNAPTVSNNSPTTSQWSVNVSAFATGTGSVVLTYSSTAGVYSANGGTINSPGNISPTGPFPSGTTYYWKVTPYTGANGTGYAGTPVTGSITTAVFVSNVTAPVISPTSGVAGSVTFSVTNGTWNGNPDLYTYQWRYWDQGSLYPAISGAISSQFTPSPNFTQVYGTSLTCDVTAKNTTTNSSATQRANYVSVSAPVISPTNASAPTLSASSLTVGGTLTAGVGTWNNSPTSYDLRIYRGTAGVLMSETLVASGTSTSLTYVTTQADYDSGARYFRVYAQASNSAGSSSWQAGTEVGPIVPATYKPKIVTSPAITPTSGTLGSTSFSCSTGSWDANPAVSSYSYQWYYLTTGGWSSYGGATSSSWTPPASLAGVSGFLYTIYCVVTATNTVGSTTAGSNSVSVSAATTTTTTTTTTTSCTCYYQDYGTYYYSPQCCPTGSAVVGVPGVSTTSGSCCPNYNKTATTTTTTRALVYWKCNSADVANPSNPCTYVGQCLYDGNTYYPAGC